MNILTYNGQKIEQRIDGYVNATQMAKANDVDISKWTKTDDFNRYADAISKKSRIGRNSLILKLADGFPAKKTTWLHPDMAIKFARWISVDFEIWCDQHIKTLMETGKTEFVEQPKLPATYIEALKALIKAEEEKEQLKLLNESLEEDNNRQAEIIDELFDYSSIIRIAKYNNCSETLFSWRTLKIASQKLNLEIKTAPCPRFGKKNLYHHQAWRLAYANYRVPETTTLVINR